MILIGSVHQNPRNLDVTFRMEATDPTLVPINSHRVRVSDMWALMRVIPVNAKTTQVISPAAK